MPQTRHNTANKLPEPGNRSRTAARTSIRPHAHTKKQSPNQFCRYDTTSSVGNPQCPRSELQLTYMIDIALTTEFAIHAGSTTP
jgi:hypothetical protein